MRTWTITIWLASMAFAAGASGAAINAEPPGSAAAGHIDAEPAGSASPRIDGEIDVEIDAFDAEIGGTVEKSDLRLSLVPVDSIPALGRLHSWSVVDNETLIIWATPSRPYLVELFRPSPELKFAVGIGVTSFGSRIHARFDSVEVGGFSYPIRRIYQMSRDEAEALKATS